MSEKYKGHGLGNQFEPLKYMRKVERKVRMSDDLNPIRDRSGAEYTDSLQGLESTLKHVAGLPIKTVIDLGAGSSRAIAQIARSKYGNGLAFKGTGILFDPAIEKHIGWDNYRLTPAETMKGFKKASVGGFISVFGPLTYSNHSGLVMSRAHELLVPHGIIKGCMSLYAAAALPDKTKIDEESSERTKQLELFLKQNGYGFVFRNRDYTSEDHGKGTDRIFLAIKPSRRDEDLNPLAQMIMDEDLETKEAMEAELS